MSDTLDTLDWDRPPRRAGWWLPWGVRWLARLATVVFAVVGYLPVGFWIFWHCQAVRARFLLGRWPRYNDPDRLSMPREYTELTPWVDVPISVLTVLLAGGLTWYYLGRPPKDTTESAPRAVGVSLRMAVVAGFVFCMSIVLLYFDPLNTRSWFAD